MHVFQNQVTKNGQTPKLSVLIPYYHDDPSSTLRTLRECDDADQCEVLLYDDGTNDQAINTNLIAMAKNTKTAVTIMIAKENHGRSEARNRLTQNARADWVLFLDADMQPQSAQFLTRYLTIIKDKAADIVFGGFTVPEYAETPETKLHRAFSAHSDCLSADERAKAGPQYVCSSNLSVRKSVLDQEPFDEDFSGWGWEDSEWAARASNAFRLLHADNPALHLGLESTETLLSRFRDSADNYAKFTAKHPELAQTLTLYKISQRLGRVPGQKLMRPVLKLIVSLGIVPTNARLFALKLWRASWYAEALS